MSHGINPPARPALSDAANPTVFLDAVLAPHRSLPPAGFLIVMLAFGGLSFVAGILFVLHGAWPVTGFFGLDVGLVYLAFRINYRSARREERIRLVSQLAKCTRRSAVESSGIGSPSSGVGGSGFIKRG